MPKSSGTLRIFNKGKLCKEIVVDCAAILLRRDYVIVERKTMKMIGAELFTYLDKYVVP